MNLYHGTSNMYLTSIIENGFAIDSWFAKNKFHAYRLAERKVDKIGGESIVLEIDIPVSKIKRMYGRDLPTYKLDTKGVKPIAVHCMKRVIL